MKKLVLLILLFTMGIASFGKNWRITNSGFTFSPSTLTISFGDSVDFSLAGIHTVQEVDQNTWNSNDITPLPGGFSTPFGGGQVLPDKLTVGTHYYVCTVHVGTTGMKGIIIVKNATGIDQNNANNNISIYPNPTNSTIHFKLNISESEIFSLKIFNIAGQKIMESKVQNGENNVDVRSLPDGLYYLIIASNDKLLYRTKFTVIK
ncbi:T9SS type A sorting domain-containing protein [Bacteroides sedimenti]|uniref:Secretion system C-terminal sorting domain-containing protein n=1 Tax=Bacteroides sedimenti TaxID=2136147 RepID=A0ABM8IFU7_9BACE